MMFLDIQTRAAAHELCLRHFCYGILSWMSIMEETKKEKKNERVYILNFLQEIPL